MLVGYTPHSSVSWSATPGWWASAMIGRRRRYFAQARAAPPVEVGTISAAASSSSASSTAARMTASPIKPVTIGAARPWITGDSSAACAISAIARTASTG